MERETGIEPATNSLEGCDSTTELLPPLVIGDWAIGRFHLACADRPIRQSANLQIATSNRSIANHPLTNKVVGRGGFEPP